MADNVELDAGAGGATVGADDITGVHYQRVKLIHGADGSNDGDVASANPLPVKATGAVAHDAAASGNPLLLGAYAKAAAPTDVSADADAVRLWALLNGALCINVTAAGALIAGDATNGLDVDVTRSALPTGAATSAKQDTIIGHVDGIEGLLGGTLAVQSGAEKVEDAAHSSGHTGMYVLAVRQDTAASTGTTDGDYTSLVTDSTGRLWCNVSNTVTVASHAVTNAGTFAVQAVCTNAGTFAVQDSTAQASLSVMDDWDNAASDGASVSGDVAHDAADAGEPVKIGGKAIASPKGLTLVAANDRSNIITDLDGLQIVKLGTSGADAISERVSNTDGASTAFTNFAAVASTYNHITSITVFRTDAGSTMAYIDFRDGTAGAILYSVPLPPAGGCTISLAGQPIFKTSANTALAFDVSAALTTVYISVSGYQSKV